MGHIKEPKGVDFVIQSGPLSKEQELALSKYIREYKAKKDNVKPSSKKKLVNS